MYMILKRALQDFEEKMQGQLYMLDSSGNSALFTAGGDWLLMNMRIEGCVLSLNLFMRNDDKAQGAWALGGCKPFNSEAGNK